MKSSFGKHIKVTVFGESHGDAIGGEVENLPAGIALDMDELMAFMKRRQGGSPFATPRKEADLPIFTQGITNGKTDGKPLCFYIPNENKRSGDYSQFRDTPRPSHADLVALARFGDGCDIRGGGHFSGRLTAPLCVAGYFAKKALKADGILVGAHLFSVGDVKDTPYSLTELAAADLENLPDFPARDPERSERMKALLSAVQKDGDSVGGIVECAAIGLSMGLGNPLFDGIENRIAAVAFGLGGVRGIEFGSGFAAAQMRGSEHNDPYCERDGKILTKTNHHGGVLGGITSGMPLLFRLAMKPTASIARPQKTYSLSERKEVSLEIKGRHDPSIAVRATVCVEALTSLVLLDFITERNYQNGIE